MEAVGEHRGLFVVQRKGRPDGGIGNVLVRLRAPGVGKAIDRDRYAAEVRPVPQGLRQIGTVGEQGLVIFPAVQQVQIEASRCFGGDQVGAQGTLEAAGIAAGTERGLRRDAVHRQRGGLSAQVLQLSHKGIEQRDGLRLLGGIGQHVSVVHQKVGGGLVAPAVRKPLVIVVQHLPAPGLGQLRAGGGLLLVGDPRSIPEGEVQSDLPPGGQLRAVQDGQGEHRPGVGQKDAAALLVAAARAGAAQTAVLEQEEPARADQDHGRAGAQGQPVPPGPPDLSGQGPNALPQRLRTPQIIHLSDIVALIHPQSLRSYAASAPYAPGRAR